MHTACLLSRLNVQERRKLHHTFNMFMFSMLCIRKRETVSYLQYAYVLDFVYQNERNCIIPTISLCSTLCVHGREKLYHTQFQILCIRKREIASYYNMFMIYVLCTWKRETASCLQYVYVLDFVYMEEGNCVIPTTCLCTKFWVSERGNQCYTYTMFMLYFVYQKEGNCIMPTICLCPRFCVSERDKLCHTYSMCLIQTLHIRKKGAVSFKQYVYHLDFVYQKQENCIIPAVWLVSELCVSERRIGIIAA